MNKLTKYQKVFILLILLIVSIITFRNCNSYNSTTEVLVTYIFEDGNKLIECYNTRDRYDLNNQIDDYLENAIQNGDITTYPVAVLVDDSKIDN